MILSVPLFQIGQEVFLKDNDDPFIVSGMVYHFSSGGYWTYLLTQEGESVHVTDSHWFDEEELRASPWSEEDQD